MLSGFGCPSDVAVDAIHVFVLDEAGGTVLKTPKSSRAWFDSARSEYYRHDTLPENAMRWSILDADLRDDLS